MPPAKGFTLVQLMFLLAALSWIGSFAIPRFLRTQLLNKRAGCYLDLKNYYDRQKAFHHQHQTFIADVITLGWSPTSRVYTYQLVEIPTREGFALECTSNLDPDSTSDRALIDQTGTIQQLVDDLTQ